MTQPENKHKQEPLKNSQLEKEIAERKSAEKELKDLQQIITRSPAVVFRWRDEENWPVDFVSNNVVDLFGYSHDDFLNQTISYSETIHPDDLERVIKEVRTPKNIVGVDTIIHKPYRIITKSGEIKWVEDKTYILRDSDGHLIQYEGIVFDITSRKRTEVALEESELKFRLLANNRYDWEYWLNPDGTYFYMSSSCEQITGYSQDEFQSNPDLLLTLVTPKYAEAVKTHFENEKKGLLKSASLEFTILTKKGEEKWIEHHCSPVFDEKGQYAGRRGYNRDITGRKQIEQRLIMSEEKFSKAFYDHPTAMQIVDMETGKRTDFNSSYCKITGYSKEELLHTNAFTMNFYADQEVQQAGLNKLITNGFAKDFPMEMIHKSGAIRNWLATVSIFDYSAGRKLAIASYVDVTERKQAEKKLQDSEEKFSAFTNQTTDGITVASLDGKYTYVNPSFCRLSGYTAEELCTMTLSDLKTDRQSPSAFLSEKANIENVPKTVNLKRKDGSEYPAEIVGSIIHIGEKTFVLETIRDITIRLNAQLELLNSETLFRESQKVAHIGSYLLDFSNGTWQSSTTLDEIFGLKNELSKNIDGWLQIVHPKDRVMMKTYFEENVLSLQEPFNKEYRIKRLSDHKERWVHGIGKLGLDQDGNPLTMVGTIQDITTRKQSEENLTILSAAIQQSPVSIMITDPSGNIEYVNPRFFQLTKYTAEEVIGKNPRFLSSGEVPKSTYRHLWKTILAGKEWRGEFHNKKKTGERYWEDVAISSIQNRQGEITHFLAIKEDITARKQADEEKSSLEKQLRRAQKLETVGTLASGIAHDFNNILAPILGYTDMAMNDQKKNTRLYKDLEHVLTAAHRAKDLVGQILLFSKQGEKEWHPLVLSSLVKEALKLLRPSIPSTIEINRKIEQTCPPILADASQIHQVIVNLCTNAWQAMEENGGKLTIELNVKTIDQTMAKQYPRLNEKSYACLTVMDTGPGMSEQVLDRIFEPFFTTKDVDKGTGLGLSVVHGIVHNHNGEIIVQSEPGKGSAFHIYIPFAKLDSAEPSLPSQEIMRGSERLMVVDDEQTISEMLGLMLTKFGYQVDTFTSGQEALDAFEKRSDDYALLISDLTMPNMTGLKLADHVHQLRPDFPVIIMTGFSNRIPLETKERHDIKEILDKPISVKGLTSMIRNVLDRK